jgi:hypothetical protein
MQTSIPNRDFVVYTTKHLPGKEYYQDLHSTSQHRVPMILVLFFPFGDQMWGVAIMRVTAKVSENTRTRMSLREYYEYFILLRKDVFNAISIPWNFINQSNSKGSSNGTPTKRLLIIATQKFKCKLLRETKRSILH